MTDFRIKVSAETEEASRKLREVDKEAEKASRKRQISFDFPSLEQTKRSLQELGQVANIAFTVFKNVTPLGRSIQDLEENVGVATKSLEGFGKSIISASKYADPVRGIKDSFGVVGDTIQGVTETTAQLGFAIFGVTQSLDILKAAFGKAFDETIGREIRLREQILQTSTALASTNRIFADGIEIDDPVKKLQALEQPLNASIERLREKSLEIAGTTSEAVIDTFGIVAQQIGNFGGTLRDAENLAAKFAGALGTLGMSDPSYARQEIGSIVRGDIGPDSVLAKTLGISNADIAKAKTQAGGLVEFLNTKLATFEAGQKKAALGFRGITSNLEELSQEIKRNFGAPILDPILKRLEAFYKVVGGKDTTKQFLQTARGFGSLVGGALNTTAGIVADSPALQNVDGKLLEDLAKRLEQVFARISTYIQEQFARAGTNIQQVVDGIAATIAQLAPAFASIAAALGRLKINELQLQLRSYKDLVQTIALLSGAYSEYLRTVEQFLSLPITGYINDLRVTFKLLSQAGIIDVVNLVIAIGGIITAIKPIKAALVQFASTISAVITSITTFIVTNTNKVSAFITALIARIVVSISSGLQTIVKFVQGVLGRIEIALNAFSTKLMLMGGVFEALSRPIYAVSTALGALNNSLDKLDVNMADFANKTRIAMGQVDAAVQKTTAKVQDLGTILGGKLVQGAQAGGNAIIGMVGGIVANIAKFVFWQIAITAVVDALGRLSEWWNKYSQNQQYKQAISSINNGLADQVRIARETGRALDAVTEARKRDAEAAIRQTNANNVEVYRKLNDELYRRSRNIKALEDARSRNTNQPLIGNERAVELARERDPEFAKRIDRFKAEIAKGEKALRDLLGEDITTKPEDTQLKQQENRQLIEDLARFERDTRQTIEDEIYNYRRQLQSRELDLFRAQGQLQIEQAEARNRKLIEGTQEEAKAGATALVQWISTKRRGELDIETKKREAAAALAEVERALGRFRLNLERQITELRKRMAQYEIDVLDKRLKAEQTIANIRNGSLVQDPTSGIQGRTGLRMGRTGTATGDHYHIEGAATEDEARAIFARGRERGVVMTSPPGPRRAPTRGASTMHGGWDLAGAPIADLDLAPGYTLISFQMNQGGLGNVATVRRDSDGKIFKLGHIANPAKGWTFNQNQSGSSYAATTLNRRAQAMQFFMEKGLPRVSAAALVGGFQQESAGLDPSRENPTSKALGIAQWTGTRRSNMLAAGGQNNFQKQLEFAWQELNTTENASLKKLRDAKTLNQALMGAASFERFAGWQRGPGGGGEWGSRVQYTKELLSGVAPGGGPGAAGINAVGGAPKAPDITLNLDTSELDTVLGGLKRVNAELQKLDAQSVELRNKESFDAFVRSIDQSSKQLEQITIDAQNQLTSYETSAKALADTPFLDRDVINLDITRKQLTDEAERKKLALLKMTREIQNATEDERKKAAAAIEAQYTKDISNLDLIFKSRLQILRLTKEENALYALRDQRVSDNMQYQRDLIQTRAEAFRSTLSPTDFVGRRQLDARVNASTRLIELTKGGTEPIGDALANKFNEEVQQGQAIAKQLAIVDSELYKFSERLRMAREVTATFVESNKNILKSVLQGNSVVDAVTQMSETIANKFTDMALDYAFKPIEQQMETFFKGVFNADSAEQANTTALSSLTLSIDNKLIPAITTLTTAVQGQTTATTAATTPGTSGTPATPEEKVNKFAETLQKATAAVAVVATSALSIAGGIQQVRKGGAYNVLMGLAGVFSGIGSVTGAFGKGGALSGLFKASGGPVTANRPYIVGERGFELFVPQTNGTVVSNDRSRALLDARGALSTSSTSSSSPEGGALTYSTSGNPDLFSATRNALTYTSDPNPFAASRGALSSTTNLTRERQSERILTTTLNAAPKPLDIRYQSEVINSTEYVSADQFQRGMSEAAERGRALTLSALKNSVRARRQIGI